MRSRRKVPGVLILAIIVFFIGLGWKYHKTITNYFGKKQSSGIVAQTIDVNSKVLSANTYSKKIVIRSLSDCQVIIRRNMFEPLGGRRIEGSLTKQITQPNVPMKQEPPKPPPDPIYELTLTGIVLINNELMALIEDSSRNRSYYLKKGDKLKDYTVDEIKDTEMILTNGDSRITQKLGSKTYYNQNGKLLATRPSYSSSSLIAARESTDRSNQPVAANNTDNVSASQSSSSSESSGSIGGNLSLIEQMKARRKRELGQE